MSMEVLLGFLKPNAWEYGVIVDEPTVHTRAIAAPSYLLGKLRVCID